MRESERGHVQSHERRTHQRAGLAGQVGGYRTAKALAWIIKLGPDAWVAAVASGFAIQNPSLKPSRRHSQRRAVAMAITVRSPISELNGLQARLLQTTKAWTMSTYSARQRKMRGIGGRSKRKFLQLYTNISGVRPITASAHMPEACCLS